MMMDEMNENGRWERILKLDLWILWLWIMMDDVVVVSTSIGCSC